MTGVVIPVKKLHGAKGRLARSLDRVRREELSLAMLTDVLESLFKCRYIDLIAVVTADETVKSYVKYLSPFITVIDEKGAFSLNGALAQAAGYYRSINMARMVIFPGDLPLLHEKEIEEFILESNNFHMTIAPDKNWSGTNGLILSPPDIVEPSFGPDSFRVHLRQGYTRNLRSKISFFPTISYDIDTAEDLAYISRYGKNTNAYKELMKIANSS